MKILILLLMFTSVRAYAQSIMPDTAVIARVDNDPVVYREFMQQAGRERSGVISYFRITYGCEYTADFWTKKFVGISPADILKKRTFDTLVKIKVQQILAKKWGIMPDISYNGFLSLLEKENKRRLEARSRNEVIYGPVQYTEDVYYNYLYTNMVSQLKHILKQDKFDIFEAKLKDIYERDKDTKYLGGFYTKVLLFKIKMANDVPAQSKDSVRNSARTTLNEERNCIVMNKNCSGILTGKYKDNRYLTVVTEEIIFNDSVYTPEEDDALLAAVRSQIPAINKGECSPVAEVPGTIYFFRVMKKKSLGYRSFENCRNTIRETYIDEQYAEYIDSILLKTEIDINQKAYNLIKF